MIMTDSTENYIHGLLGQMNLAEKIGQLNQLSAADLPDLDLVRQGKLGSVLHAAGALTGQVQSGPIGAQTVNQLQNLALESRLRIPLIVGRDVIHGFRTVFPIPLAQAAAFDPDLSEQAAAVAAREATADGIKWAFAPMIDIARDPRWGRVAEGSGEDPFLGAQMAASLVRGFQGDDYAQPDKLVACAKHYVGYGSAEGGRDYENGEISEPTLRDVYLPPFESAVRAGVGTLMAAFLDLNGVPASANRRLLTGVLRQEWGFDGFVVSDWASIAELVTHGVAEDRAEAAALALRAGVDMDMASESYFENLANCLGSGRVSIQEIDQAVLRILRIKQRAGLFENPFTDPERYARQVLTPEARNLARRFARQSMVLLKNQAGLLPLEGLRRICIAGNYSHASSELYGSWSMDGQPEDVTPVDQALRAAAPAGVELWFAENHDQALDFAQQSDASVLLLGEHPRRSGENANLSDLTLEPEHARLIASLSQLGKPLVLVVFTGRPLALTQQLPQVDALLVAWQPGIEGGAALGEILFGQEAPSGRLPITFPRATGQVPIYYNHKNSGRPVAPDSFFRFRYLDVPHTPLFPFGFGLSTTRFEYSHPSVSQPVLRGGLSVSAQITNLGPRAGSSLAQLYVRDLVGSITRPVRELKGFQRLELQPGESRQVSFDLSEEMLVFTRADGTRGVEPGRFQVWIAPDSASGEPAEFRL